MLLLLGWENLCSLHPIFTLPYSKAVLLHRWQLSVELIKLFALHWMSLSFTHLMLTYTQEDWPTHDWLFSIPGLTWRQIETGLADDCSSLIGAVSWPTLEPSAGGWMVPSAPLHLRSAANNPHQATRGQPISPHLPAIVVLLGFLLLKAAFGRVSQHHSEADGTAQH